MEKKTMSGKYYAVKEVIFLCKINALLLKCKYEFDFSVWMLIKLENFSKRNEIIMNDVCSGYDFLFCRES